MLTETEIREIDRVREEYKHPRAAIVDALKIIQRHRGWVSDDAVSDLSAFLGVSEADLESVATFYNLIFRRPVGRHVVLVCDSITCWIVGCDALCEAIRTSLGIGYGETTDDGRFTLLPSVCLGNCNHAPAIMIDDDHHGAVDPGNLESLLERYE